MRMIRVLADRSSSHGRRSERLNTLKSTIIASQKEIDHYIRLLHVLQVQGIQIDAVK